MLANLGYNISVLENIVDMLQHIFRIVFIFRPFRQRPFRDLFIPFRMLLLFHQLRERWQHILDISLNMNINLNILFKLCRVNINVNNFFIPHKFINITGYTVTETGTYGDQGITIDHR